MDIRPGREFNILGVMPQELQVRLAALASYGAGITGIFTSIADKAGLTEKGRAEREKEYDRMEAVARVMMASQERMAEFQRKLDRLDRANYEALIENEERLRAAQEELARIRERAFEVTKPDGTVAKVYRDGDKVRDDDGQEVSDKIIRAEDIPDAFPDWGIRRGSGEAVEDLRTERRQIMKHREKIDHAREVAADGPAPKDDVEDLDALLNDMPDAVRRRTGEPAPEQNGTGFTRPAPNASTPGPM